MLDKFKRNFYKFMEGRYGAYGLDLVNKRLNSLFFILVMLGLIFSIAGKDGRAFTFAGFITWLIFTYRALSKDIGKRSKANAVYFNFENGIKKKLLRIKRRLVGTKTHTYTACPKCKTEIRLPKGKGKLKVVCPKCKETFIKRT